MASTKTDLTREVEKFARSEGAVVVGFSPVERFEEAPEGHRPVDFVPGAKSVVAFGMRISDAIVDYSDYHNRFTGKASFAKEPAPRLGYAKAVRSNIYLYMGHYVQDDLLAYWVESSLSLSKDDLCMR